MAFPAKNSHSEKKMYQSHLAGTCMLFFRRKLQFQLSENFEGILWLNAKGVRTHFMVFQLLIGGCLPDD